jgi:ketosteroid isomerase-like protein
MSSAASGGTSVAQEIHAIEARFMKLASEKDAAGLTEAFYAEDAQLLAPGAPLVRGRAAIRDFWTAFLQVAGNDVTLETHTAEAAGDLAYGVGRFAGTIGGAHSTGKYVVVYKRQSDGGLKAIADAFNADA